MNIKPNEVIAKFNPTIVDDCNIIEQQFNAILEEHELSLCFWSGNFYLFDNCVDQIIGVIEIY